MRDMRHTVGDEMAVEPKRVSRSRQLPWYAGFSWKGGAFIVAFAVVNALRRNMNSSYLIENPSQWWLDLATTILTGIVVALTVVVAVVVAVNRLPLKGWKLVAALIFIAAAASFAGSVALTALELALGAQDGVESLWLPGQNSWLRYVPLAVLFAGAYAYFRLKGESLAAMREVEAERAQLDQRMSEARLGVLQAQIEPHFLFNTLANVRRLYKTDPATASVMLDNLMRYLAVALPRMRDSTSTLGREIALADAYLEIHRIRMGRRLDCRIDVSKPLNDAAMPPMMLLTLVENAIKHGLNPLPQGGSIAISAKADERKLQIEVADTGRGFTKTSGGGAGIANIRARLAAQFQSDASLRLASNVPHGVTATITLPLSVDHSAGTP